MTTVMAHMGSSKNYETMKQLNPVLMQNIFSFKSSANLGRSQRNAHDLLHHRPNQTNLVREWAPISNEICSKYFLMIWDGLGYSCMST